MCMNTNLHNLSDLCKLYKQIYRIAIWSEFITEYDTSDRMRGIKTRTFRFMMMKKNTFQKILITNLGLNSDEAKLVVDMNKKTMTYAVHRFINNCLLCRKYEVEVRPFEHFQFCLGLIPHTLEHRINILKDIGVQNVNVTQLSKLVGYLRKPIYEFNKLTDISVNQDIRKNIFNRLGESSINTFNLKLNNKIRTIDCYNICLLFCKTQIFDLPNLDNKVLLEICKYKSISMIAETLKVLRLDLGFNNEYIMNYPKIIIAPAENVKSLLNNFKNTGLVGLPIEQVLKKYPILLFEDANNMKQLLKSFKRYNIPEENVRKFIRILTLANDFFVERMGIIMKHPDLYVWYKHPRILELVYHKNMVLRRAEYLRYMNRIKWARANTILSRPQSVDQFIQYGLCTVMLPKPLQHLLNTKLKISLENTDLIKKLKRHPHWKATGYDDVEKMLDYLLRNFTVDEICQNIHIILYSRSVVEEKLAELRQKYFQSTEYSFTDSQYLALCLYMLEKDTHFTGDGIWSKGHNVKKQSLSNNKSAEQNVNRTDSDANVGTSNARIDDEIDPKFYDKNEMSTT